MLRQMGVRDLTNDTVPPEDIERCIFEGLKDSLMKNKVSYQDRGNTKYRFTISDTPIGNAVIDRESTLDAAVWEHVVSAGNNLTPPAAGGNIYMKLCQGVPASWVPII